MIATTKAKQAVVIGIIKNSNLNVTQICQITGIGYNIVYRIFKQHKNENHAKGISHSKATNVSC